MERAVQVPSQSYPKPIITVGERPWEHPEDRVEILDAGQGNQAYFHQHLKNPILVAGPQFGIRLEEWILKLANSPYRGRRVLARLRVPGLVLEVLKLRR